MSLYLNRYRVFEHLKALVGFVVIGCLWAATTSVSFGQSPLRIEITGVGTKLIPVAIPPLDAQDSQARLAQITSEVLRNNLSRSGSINLIPTGTPQPALNESTPVASIWAPWSDRGAAAMVVGSLTSVTDGRMETRFVLLDVQRKLSLGGLSINAPATEMEARRTGHRIADFVYEKLTGEPGFFATRLAFVRKDKDTFSLIISDSDGQNAQVALRSQQPVISLAWSPDGSKLAYVSFETRDGINKPVVYTHTLANGARTIVANEKGSNSSPTWSPDSRQLAVVLSRDGVSQIYLVNPDGTNLRRVSRGNSIDTEPAFSPDGRFLYFTSDRGGTAQIYRLRLDSEGPAERITFSSSFNGRPQISPDGKTMVYVTRREGLFRIATMNLASKEETLISDGPKDDSPSFAPNGRWIIYSSRFKGRDVMTAVSQDGKLRSRLSADGGAVRGPAWGKLP
jgi:TolB protein